MEKENSSYKGYIIIVERGKIKILSGDRIL
jgi:hypothetical protein